MSRLAYALINLQNLKHNASQLKSIAPRSRVMAIVKANAYGHGMHQVALALSSIVDAFGVACVGEAVQLRESNLRLPIVVLQGFSTLEELKAMAHYQLDVVIHCSKQLDLLHQYSASSKLNVWLKIDTGMHRLGFYKEQIKTIYDQLRRLPNIGNIQFMTHLARADESSHPATAEQIQKFERVISDCQFTGWQSVANSAAILAWPTSHRDWIRPGLLLYGVSPFDAPIDSKHKLQFKPVMNFRAPIIAVKQCQESDAIGYGGDYVCPKDMRVAIVAAGYADGYPRHVQSPLHVGCNGRLAPLVGRVSMDMLTIDVTGMDVEIDQEVELWGENPSVQTVAQAASTISYELLCKVSHQVDRKYVN